MPRLPRPVRRLWCAALCVLLLPALGHAAPITRAQVETALSTALAEKLATEAVAITLDRATAEVTGDGPARVATLDVDTTRKTFTATVAAGGAAGGAEQIVTGRYTHLVQAVVPARDLAPGEVITEDDLGWLPVDEKALNSRVAAEPEQLVGMEVRRPLKAEKLVLARDIRAPRLIAKGDTVTVRLRTAAMDLSMQGRALSEAGMGETVRVLNLTSKKTIEGIVTGPQTVEIAPAVAGQAIVPPPIAAGVEARLSDAATATPRGW